MAKRGSQKERDDQRPGREEALKDAHETDAGVPSENGETDAGLPLDALLQAGQEQETAPAPSSGEEEEDFASLLASFQDQKKDGDRGENGAETDEDRELSQMISLMASHDPGRSYSLGAQDLPGEDGEDTDTLPEGAEVVLDPATEIQEDGAGAFPEASDTAELDLLDTSEETVTEAGETALSSLAEGEEAALDAEPPALPAEEDEEVAEEAIGGYGRADNVDALLSAIGLDDGHEGGSFVPLVPEGGIQDDGTPPEELVDDRILDDLRELHENLRSSPLPATAGLSAFAGLPGGLAEGPARILSIDDDPDNRSLFRGILDEKDYAFSDAESGEEALEALRDGEVDLVLLNLDIASQDGFELIEEAASDVTLSQIPILVNSASTDHIEKALRLGASDYFTRPMNVIDVKFQIPIKVGNLLKIRRAERMLALAGDPHSEALAVSPQEEIGEELGAETRGAKVSEDHDLAGLLNAPDAPSVEPAKALDPSSLEALFDEESEETGNAEEDLAAVLNENEEALTGEGEEDLTAALESEEDPFEQEEEDGEEGVAAEAGGTQEDPVLAAKEEGLDRLFDDEEPSEHPVGKDQAGDDIGKIAGLGVAGAAAAAVGVAAMRPEPKPEEESRSAADILAQSPGRGPAPVWRSPDMARSQRERMLQERRVEMPRRSGGRRLIYAFLALLLVGVGVWALWAKQRLRETGELTSVIPTPPKFEAPERAGVPEEKPAEPSPAAPEPGTSSETAPSSSPRQPGDYEQAREKASVPSRAARQLASEKAHIRATVDQIATSGGQWWAPWRVIRESGESIKELVNERQRGDILDAFGASEEKVEQGLKRRSVVDFLSKRGFRIRGKQASDLSAREVFEILSMREIKTKNRIVAILSALKDKASTARAERAARLKAAQPDRLALRPESRKVEPPARNVAFWEHPDQRSAVGSQRSANQSLPVFSDS